MLTSLFGKKRKSTRKRTRRTRRTRRTTTKSNKLPRKLISICKKLKVKLYKKVGKKRVHRSVSVLKKACLKRIKVLKKKMNKRKSRFGKARKTTKRTKRRFGVSKSLAAPYVKYNSGYENTITRVPGIRSQSSSVAIDNKGRPYSVPNGELPAYGTYARFFNEKVPKVLPPEWMRMKQPGKESDVMVGTPFYRYTTPNKFGRRRRFGVIKDYSDPSKGGSTVNNNCQPRINNLNMIITRLQNQINSSKVSNPEPQTSTLNNTKAELAALLSSPGCRSPFTTSYGTRTRRRRFGNRSNFNSGGFTVYGGDHNSEDHRYNP